MANLALTMACGPYDRMEALRTGEVKPEGIDLTCLAIENTNDLVTRAAIHEEFDVAEMYLALYMSRRSEGQFPYVAIPVFPSRVFRHGFIFINTDSGVRVPKDLEGKRIGVETYRLTAGVWMRGILQHEYGVRLDTIHWVEGGIKAYRPPFALDVKPQGAVSLEFAPQGRALNDMLQNGDLDALTMTGWPDSFYTSPHVTRLFPNHREAEREYYRKTGIFPIMHALVVRESIYREHPWVAPSLFNAAVESKMWMLGRLHLHGTLRFMLPWMHDEVEEMFELMGPDPWPYGLEANRVTLETLVDYLVEQGLMPQRASIEELFVPVETSQEKTTTKQWHDELTQQYRGEQHPPR